MSVSFGHTPRLRYSQKSVATKDKPAGEDIGRHAFVRRKERPIGFLLQIDNVAHEEQRPPIADCL